jgi:protein FRA10AC1
VFVIIRFVRDLDEDESTLTWEQRVAKRYYDQLFKEYCLADLRYYREGKVNEMNMLIYERHAD